MATLQPWYKVVSPREDLRDGKPLDASEFAVHLDHVREARNGHAIPNVRPSPSQPAPERPAPRSHPIAQSVEICANPDPLSPILSGFRRPGLNLWITPP